MTRACLRYCLATAFGFVVLAVLGRMSLTGLGAESGFSPAAGLAAATVAAGWKWRRSAIPAFGLLAVAVRFAMGAEPMGALAFGAGLAVEAGVAGWLMRRHGDPVERPETSAWWARWGLAATVGVIAGAATLILIDRPAESVIDVGFTWVTGHGAGLVLVSPGVWAGLRWSATGGWRHRYDLVNMAQALGAIGASMVVGAHLSHVIDSPLPLVGPFFVLGWLAHSKGHRVTVMSSSMASTVILLAIPWWIGIPSGATAFGVAMSLCLGHVAASAVAIEASARWHARALLAGVVDIAAEAVLIVDGDGRVMTGNPAAARLFGAGLEGAVVTDLIRGLPDGWIVSCPSSLMVHGRSESGRIVALEVSVGPVDAPGRPMLALVCRDMTEIKAAVAAVRRSAEIIDASPDLVGWTDQHGNVLFLNEAGRSMIGAPADEVIDAWSAAGVLSRDAIRAAEVDGVWRGETQIVARSGSHLPVQQTVVAHRNDEGSVRYYSVLARDISEHYALEQMKNEFVSNVTHELRSPLTCVIGFMDLLLEETFGELPSEAVAALHEVQGAANVMLELINDLLALWRAEDRGTGDPVDLDLGEVVQAAIRTLEPVAAGKRIGIRFRADTVLTVGDRRQLERAFLNLVSNAVKFTPVGGGDVVVEVSWRPGRAVVEITDSGVGIPVAELEAIFDRFYRATTAEQADIPGTGLGLPLVRQVVHAHGGEVGVRSEVGVGTTFSIELPVLVRTPVAV